MPKGLIFYGSLTGNTELVAIAMHQKLAELLPQQQLDLLNVRDVTPERVAQYDFALFGTSTWDDLGNPDGEEFCENLGKTAVDLSHTTFALFGLGDSSYHDFCGAINLSRTALQARQARIYPETFTIDGYPEDEHIDGAVAWAQAFIRRQIETMA